MRIRLGTPLTGRQILEAFKMAFQTDPDRKNRWVISDFSDRIEYELSGRDKVASATCTGVLASHEENCMSDHRPSWPVEVRTLRLCPLNPQIKYHEFTIEVGTLPEKMETLVLDGMPHINTVIHAAMERFNAKLYSVSLAA